MTSRKRTGVVGGSLKDAAVKSAGTMKDATKKSAQTVVDMMKRKK